MLNYSKWIFNLEKFLLKTCQELILAYKQHFYMTKSPIAATVQWVILKRAESGPDFFSLTHVTQPIQISAKPLDWNQNIRPGAARPHPGQTHPMKVLILVFRTKSTNPTSTCQLGLRFKISRLPSPLLPKGAVSGFSKLHYNYMAYCLQFTFLSGRFLITLSTQKSWRSESGSQSPRRCMSLLTCIA